MACASPQWSYEKTNVTPRRIEQDMAVCRKESGTPSRLTLWQADRFDRDGFNRCMERKGYEVSVEK